jgi:hypothetical protein
MLHDFGMIQIYLTMLLGLSMCAGQMWVKANKS